MTGCYLSNGLDLNRVKKGKYLFTVSLAYRNLFIIQVQRAANEASDVFNIHHVTSVYPFELISRKPAFNFG